MIEVCDVTRTFGEDVRALSNVSIKIEEGEFITLLGPSGCGKTTLLRILAGFDRPTSGSIRLAGKDVTRLPPYERDLNMVFQDYALFPHLSVFKNVAFGLERKGVAKPEIKIRVDQALKMVELADKAARWPHELSGGQRQRVALARALVRNPRVLLLDEPLSALDAGLREAMQIELKNLHQKLGITFVMVTHDQKEALVMSDRIVVMHQGRIAQVGSPDALYHTPKTPYVASFIGTTNLFEGSVQSCDDGRISVRTGAGVLSLAAQPGIAKWQRVKVGIRPENLRVVNADTTAKDNLFRCTVRDTLFHGNHTRFRCQLPESGELLYWDWLPSRHEDQTFRPVVGSELVLAAETRDLLLFPLESAQ